MSRTPIQKKRPAILATTVAAMLGLGLLLGAPRAVADEYWDGTTTTGSGVANGKGGSGTWNSTPTNKNWVNIDGLNPAVYDSGQLAIFSTTGGTVTLGANENFTALRFDVDGYTITGPFTLTPSATATITTASNVTVTINPVITGAGSITAQGSGTINLAGANNYTGGTVLSSGRLNANSTTALGTGTLTINGGTIGTTASGGQTISNPVVVGGNFSIATNVDASLGNQNLTFSGTVNLGGETRTITGVIPGGQVHFGNVISNGGIKFTTNATVNGTAQGSGPYVSFIYEGATSNTYTGLTTVDQHAILVLSGTAVNGAIQGNVDIEGNGVVDYINGAAGSNQINDTSTVTDNSSGNTIAVGSHFDGLELRDASDTIGALLGNGSVGLGSGTLTVGTNNLNSNFTGFIEDGAFGTGGGVTKIGTGTLILGGPADATTYTGPTTISAGTLETTTNRTTSGNSVVMISSGATFDLDGHVEQVGGIADGTGAGTISLGSGVLATGFKNTDTTFSGVIQDGGISGGTGGSLVKAGTAMLTLSGANTYTGATEVFGGTLRAGKVDTIPLKSAVQVNAGATFDLNNLNQSVGSIADDVGGGGTINLGSATLTTGNDNTNTTFFGVIQGTGGLTKVGTGTQDLQGANTYFGPTLVSAGTLGLSGTSSSPVTVSGGATFGVISTAGVLNSSVTASNTTGVATIVNFGTINGLAGVGIDASTSTGGVKITNFGTIKGTVTLGTGANTIVLATQLHPIQPSPLIPAGPGNNNTLELAGSARDSFNLVTAPNFEFLNKVGGGLWILTGTGNFPSGTTISGGTVAVQSNLVSNVVVQSGGTLAGTGFVTGNVFNGGVVMPGTPNTALTPIVTPAMLAVKGSYTQAPTGALVIQIYGVNAGQYSQLSIGGHAQLSGSLLLQNNGAKGLKLGQKLTFLTAADGVSGTFSDVTNPFATGSLIIGKVVYESNDVVLEGAQGSFLSIDSQFHLTPNQKAVATALDNAGSDPRATQLLTYLDNQRLKKLPSDFDRIAPEEIASVYRIGDSLADVQARNVQRRAADLRAGASGFSTAGFQTTGGPSDNGSPTGANGPIGADAKPANTPVPDRRWGTFITGVGDFVHVGDSANANGYDLDTDGVTLGADYKLNDHLAVGLTAGYVGTNAILTNDGRLRVNGGKVGVYGTYFTGGFHTDAAVTGGYSSYSTRRSALQGDAFGRTEGGEVDVLADTGYDWRLDALTIGPTASFQYTSVGVDGFTERGSLAPLRYAGQQHSSIRSTFGLRMAYDWKVGNVIVRPEGEFAWQHEYRDRSYSIDSTLASGAGSMFSVADTRLGRDSLLFGGGVSVLWNPRTSTYLYYDADLLKKEYYSQSVTGGLRMNF